MNKLPTYLMTFLATNAFANPYAASAGEGGGGFSALIILAAIMFLIVDSDFKNDKPRSYRNLLIAGVVIFLTIKFSIWIDAILGIAFLVWIIFTFITKKNKVLSELKVVKNHHFEYFLYVKKIAQLEIRAAN